MQEYATTLRLIAFRVEYPAIARSRGHVQRPANLIQDGQVLQAS